VLMILASLAALYLKNAKQAFDILLLMGAGTGLLFILRWFWWRINALSEIVAMVVSFLAGILLYYSPATSGWESYEKLLAGVSITTVAWIVTTLFTRPTDEKTLKEFYVKIRPYAYGWKPIAAKLNTNEKDSLEKVSAPALSKDILMMFLGCVFVYFSLFGTGYLIYGKMIPALATLSVSVITAVLFFRIWNR